MATDKVCLSERRQPTDSRWPRHSHDLPNERPASTLRTGRVTKSADVRALGARARKSVRVRVPPRPRRALLTGWGRVSARPLQKVAEAHRFADAGVGVAYMSEPGVVRSF